VISNYGYMTTLPPFWN